MCGCGVTSVMLATSSPWACRVRMAVSLPEPGPFTKTSTFFMPCSCALRATFSAVTCAAKGVLLREPLKPTVPALAHTMVLPCLSVMVIMVLLKVDLMCASPCRTFFFSRFLTLVLPLGLDTLFLLDMYPRRLTACLALIKSPYFFFRFTPTVLRGPLRVRALVWVRWPRTGKPTRCRSPW